MAVNRTAFPSSRRSGAQRYHMRQNADTLIRKRSDSHAGVLRRPDAKSCPDGTVGWRGSRTPVSSPRGGAAGASTSQAPCHHIQACAYRSRNGVRYHQRTHVGARSSRGASPDGGVQFQAGRTPGGTAQPAGDGTRVASTGRDACCQVSRRKRNRSLAPPAPRPEVGRTASPLRAVIRCRCLRQAE
jgi:hypothetical protein